MISKEEYSTRDVVTPKNGMFQVYVDHYWWCEDGDPKKALFYKERSAQCSNDKKVLEHFGTPYPTCKIVKIPVSYIKRTNN